jgi:hypothetical protein
MVDRSEVVKLIEILGYPYAEVITEFTLSNIEVSSIAYIKETKKIILYKWFSDYEMQYDFDELDSKDQRLVYLELSKYILN